MTLQRFDIRAEYPESRYSDFHVTAEDLFAARDRAEDRVRDTMKPDTPAIEWRGLVMFVGRQP